jgi:glycosyltransferase involved in cell wall biosynthesis
VVLTVPTVSAVCKAPCVPPEPSATSPRGRLSIGFDATPLLGTPTGVGMFCAGALSGLSARPELEVSAYAVSWRRRHALTSLVPAGVTVRQRAMPARPLHRAWGRFSEPPIEWFIGPRDVVHGSNFVVPPARRAARVMTVHDLGVVRYPALCDPSTLVFPELIRRAAAGGAWVHTPSRFVADEVVSELGIDPERVRAVHHGIPRAPDTASWSEASPSSSGLPPSDEPPLALPDGCRRYILAIGTIEPRKDYPLLVSAFSSVAAALPDVALVIVGRDGWGLERYQAAVQASPARGRIVRPGYLDDRSLDVLLHRAAVLAYPSVYEGFGFPPLQAMAAGVPVVATSAGAVPEVVGDGAVLVDPGDGDALAAELIRVLAGGSEVERLIERGRLRSGAFTWTACAEGLARLYGDAVRAEASVGRAGRAAAKP